MTRGAARLLVTVALLCLAGCEQCAPAEPAEPVPEPSEATEPQEPQDPQDPQDPQEDPERTPAVARITRVTGADGQPVQSAVLTQGQELEANAALSTGEGGLVVDFLAGGRVELGPHTRIRLGAEAPQQAILGAGELRALLPPAGGSPRPPLRVGARAGSAIIEGSGDVFVATLPDGAVWVGALAGRIEVVPAASPASPERPDGGAAGAVTLIAGQALTLDGGAAPTEPGEGARTLRAARARVTELRAAREAIADEAADAALQAAAEAFDVTLAALQSESGRGQALSASHRRAVREEDPQAPALQRQLVAHSQALHRKRTEALAAFERLVAHSIGRQASPDPAAARRPRLRALLGLP